MSAPINRRAALGAFAGLPALAILPAAGSTLALVSPTSPDHPARELAKNQKGGRVGCDRQVEGRLGEDG
jgi:hypothetical protein